MSDDGSTYDEFNAGGDSGKLVLTADESCGSVGLLGGGRGTAMNDKSRVLRHRSLNLGGDGLLDAEIDSLSRRPKHLADYR